MDYELLIDEALQKAKEIPSNKAYELKDLFDIDTWESFGNYRGALGNKFRKRIAQEDLGIKQIQQAARLSNKYININ